MSLGKRQKLTIRPTEVEPAITEPPLKVGIMPGRKDTKKWCRGHVGQLHLPVLKTSLEVHGGLRTPQQIQAEKDRQEWLRKEVLAGRRQPWYLRTYKIWVCVVCGKHLGYDESSRNP